MSDTPIAAIEPIADPTPPDDAAIDLAPAAPSLPERLRVLVDLARPDDHPDAPGVWPAGAIIAAWNLDVDHIPLLRERGIVDVDAPPEVIPDAPPEP